MRKPVAALVWATQIMFAKRWVLRLSPSFDVDLSQYQAADFSRIVPWLTEVEERLKQRPADRQGMRWIHLRDRVLFLADRTFDLPYDDFVTQVHIGHVGQFYRDSLGVATQVVERDELERPLCQGVRVLALPQPNYAAFLGKEELDVYKLEKIDRWEREQRVWMLTVYSPNGSAVCDDGYMSFRATSDGTGTIVTFLACQQFPIPPLMALARLDRWSWFKTLITESAYRRFFNVMMRNIERAYYGRSFRVGRSSG